MADAVSNAVEAVANSIAAAAKSESDPDKLKTLADGAAVLRFGPQGWAGQTNYRYDAHSVTEAVNHAGERHAPRTGFTANGAG